MIQDPLFKGKLRFDLIQEGPSNAEHRTIAFDPPLIADYSIWPKEDGLGGFEEPDKPFVGHFTFDFGMTGSSLLLPEHNFLINGYENLTTNSTAEEILIKVIIFDIFHALCHCKEDPNYSHYHWALSGWLKDRSKIVDFD